jgi:catechol 2,3-dioxygenase-like lactoylglutathione lyase family enzyme
MGTAVRYIVEDPQAAVPFYVLLGFEVVTASAPGFAVLRRGDLRLLLNAPGAGGAGQGSPVPGGWNRFQLEVTDLDAEMERLDGQGVRFRSGIVEGRGGRQVLAEDPSGNAVELFEPAPR